MESGRIRLGISNEAWRRKARDMSSVNESDTDVSYDLSDGSISLPACVIGMWRAGKESAECEGGVARVHEERTRTG